MAALTQGPEDLADAPPRSKADAAYEDIRHRLITLLIAPGEAINEASLAEELGVGRTPVREALKRLEGDHLVMTFARRGTFATNVDVTDLAQISEVREQLEPLAARYAVHACRGAVRDEFERMLAELNSGGGPGERTGGHALMEQDMRVHRLIYSCVDNGYLAETLIRLDDLATRLWFMVLDRIPNVDESVREHVALLEAVLAGDPDRAATLAAEHVRHFEQSVGRALGRGPVR